MLWDIHNALLENAYIQSLQPQITFYKYPDYTNFSGVHIVIDPIMPPKPSDFGDMGWTTEEHFYFIEVWSKKMDERDNVARVIQDVLNKQLLFRQFSSGESEYNKDYKIYRDMRKYRGKKNLI